ncbi:hypothetical protein HMPREF1624_00572 [Sporothrix schenckii ATCC 58251]|uniref:MOSC domain-containing protein n=1 Tax=Sporothrix schenckii (strain ATCC 58251 / de Perez 2211183) TaxID=1391915 RepID=U7Q2Z9_SPOS1|nr:hypothetical protein HMPREF1624_00572 [Sporothrix schenckii ATCC 58251]
MGETTRAPESPLSGGTQSGVSADPSQGNTSTKPAATPSAPVLDLYEPITSDVILEVRSGKMKALEGLKITSAIDKDLCPGRVKVGLTGIVDDEHDYTFHGGIDKAVHGYCASHYPTWQREFPAAAARFRPGGFGENLVFARLNERNIHIGDVFAVGPKINGKTHTGLSNEDVQGDCLLLQVSLPRQPCFKLNHRFGLRNFAPNTWKTSRTGWYYRVLRPGTVQAGDEVRLVRRPNPAWPLERVQEYLHRSPNEMAMVEELAAIDEFGAECKNQFKSRLAKHEAQQRKKARMAEGGDGKPDDKWLPFRVVEKTKQTPRIMSFVFEAVDPPKPDADPNDDELDLGSHVRLRLGGGSDGGDQKDGGLVRSYSIVKGNKRRFELGIAYDAATSRGGSRFLHEAVSVGSIVHASAFAAGVPIVSAASHHVYVAGGVGITAFLAHLESLTAINYSCVLHYAVRSAEEVAFAERLKALGPDVVIVYDASKGQRMDIASIVSNLQWNAHISFCGPTRMMDAALEATRASSLSDNDVHFEAFSADTTGDPFDVVVRRAEDASNGDNADGDTGDARAAKTLRVDEDETLLEVLQREFGVDAVASSCEVGNCATCKVTVCAGRIDHRGTALTSEEKAAGNSMLSCVSRGIGRIEIEI